MTNVPGHSWRDKSTAPSGPLSKTSCPPLGRSAVGALRQVVDGVGGFKAMRIKRRVDSLAFK